jgi:peptidoglycan/LPS O-acetylase OafA/YrhL
MVSSAAWARRLTGLKRLKATTNAPSPRKLILSSQTSEPERNNFDAIRLAMAMLVVWSHSFALHLGSERSEWISLMLNGTYNAGNLGVMAFFVISGFLITQSWERSKSARSYFGKRVRRIYPGFLVCIAICAFVIAPLFGGQHPDIAKLFGMNLLLKGSLPSAFPHNLAPGPVNGSLWSIFYEFWCYVGVAIVGSWLVKRRRFLVGLCLMLIAGKVLQDITGKKPGHWLFELLFGWPYLWTKIGPSFVLGMIAYSYRQYIPRSRIALAGLLAVALIGCHLGQPVADFVAAPALAYAVFFVAFSRRIQLHEAAALGDFSYGTYLYAFPIQQMIQATFGRSLNLGEFILASMIFSLIAGVISWHLVEKHFLPRRVPKTPSLLPT